MKENGNDMAWWNDRNLPQKILIGIGFGILGIGLIFVFGYVVMLLWNWLMPDIFGLKTISYWQAWGLLALCTILFKGFGSSASGNANRSDRKRKQKLRQYIRDGECADPDPANNPSPQTSHETARE